MRKIIIFTIASAFIFTFMFSGCKKNNTLKYKSLWGMSWLTGNVVKGDKQVVWFQLFDQSDPKDKQKTIDSYSQKSKKFNNKYPATITDSMIWILINNRFEIRLIADSKCKEYKSKEKLSAFLNKFDLAGLEKITGPKMKADDLKKYCPKLPMVKKKK